MKDCINYDSEFDCCKVLSDWSDPMPVLQPCIESPCKYYESKGERKPMATINTDTGRIKLIRNCTCGGRALFSFHTVNDASNSDVIIECERCGSQAFTEFDDIENINQVIDATINRWNKRCSNGK